MTGKAVHRAPDDPDRINALGAALGSIPDTGHDWDDDAAAWVRRQRADRPSGSGCADSRASAQGW
jgi:hypothetical protein